MSNISARPNNYQGRLRLGLIIVLIGELVFILGTDPGVFGLDRSPVTGFVQISVFLVGEALICLGGYFAFNALWAGEEKSILADIGLRVISTGYLISFASGLADVFGFGSHLYPNIPYFGPVQAIGVMIGLGVIIAGFVLLIPYHMRHKLEAPER